MKQTDSIRHESKREPGGVFHALANLLRKNKPGLLACLVAIVLCSAFAGAVASAQTAVPENPAKTYNASASTVAWTGDGYDAPTDDGPTKEKPKSEVTVELPPDIKEEPQETAELDTPVSEDATVDSENGNPAPNVGGDNPDEEVKLVIVPDVVGKSAAEAKHLIELAGLVPDGPDEGVVGSQVPSAGTEADRGSTVEFFVEDDKVKVPNLFGMEAAEARQEILNADLVPKGDGEGTVVNQNPDAGVEVVRGSVVEYFVEPMEPNQYEPEEPVEPEEPKEPEEPVEPEEPSQNDVKVEMPSILGLSASDAKAVIAEFGLIPNGPDEGTVISQTPEAHTMLSPGETVYFDVEAEPEYEPPNQCLVPNIIGMSATDAVAAIIAAGLTPNGPDEGTVIDQDPAENTQLDSGALVSYSVENAEPTPVGSITFTLETNTIGLGTLIEPCQVDVYEGEALPEVIERVLPQYGLEFRLDGGYLSYIKRTGITDGWEIPENLLAKIEEDGSLNDHHQDTLGEFDFTGGSGWVYFVNDEKMSTGMQNYYPPDGDAVRLHFQLFDGDDKY